MTDVCDVTSPPPARQAAASRLRKGAEDPARPPVGLIRTDGEGRVTFVDDGWVAVTGRAAARSLGDGWLAALHLDDRARVGDAWAAAVAERESLSTWARLADRERPVLLDVASLPEGGAIAVVREQLADAAAASRLLGALDEGILLVGPSGRVLDASHRLCEIVGLPREAVVGSAPPYPSAADGESVCVRPDGTRIPVLVTRVPLDETSTSIIGVRDMSERAAAAEALHDAEESFRAAFEHAPIGMAIVELDAPGGTVRRGNRALAAILETDASDLAGRSLEDLVDTSVRNARSELRRLLGAGLPERRAHLPARAAGDAPRWLSIGASTVRRGRPDAYAIVQIEDVTERREIERRLARMALQDGLTRLPNRVMLTERLEAAVRDRTAEGRSVGVLFVDLDGFKEINDVHGHRAGDEVLTAVAGRLRGLVRPSDLVARQGGDEFVVLCDDLAHEPEILAIAERARQALSAPIRITGTTVDAPASIGVAIARPSDTPDTLLRAADSAMYRAKQAGGNAWALAPRSDGG